LASVDAILQAKGDDRLVKNASKICTTFYEKWLVEPFRRSQVWTRPLPISYGVPEPVPVPEKLTP
jgi:hypothetical protein